MISRRDIIIPLRSSWSVVTCWIVSIAQTRTTFCVLHGTLPLCNFFRNIGSSHAVSSSELGRKILLMERNRFGIIFCISAVPPCKIPIKLLIKTSSCYRYLGCACREEDSHLLYAARVATTSSGVVCRGGVATRFSKGWGGKVFL